MPNVNLSPYTAESEAIANRMRMAQLIGQQSMQPMEMPQQPGAKFSPYQGLAKMMQAYVSVLGQNKAAEQQAALAEKYQAGNRAEMGAFLGARFGSPSQPATPATVVPNATGADTADNPNLEITGNQGIAPGMAAVPAVAPDRQKAMALALGSQNPMLQGYGGAMLSQMDTPKPPINVAAGGTLYDPTSKEVIFTAPRDRSPIHVAPGGSILDPNTMQPVYTAPKERVPNAAEAEYNLAKQEGYKGSFVDFMQNVKRTPPNQNVTYGSPVAAVGANGQPVFIQPGKGGGAPSVIEGFTPPAEKLRPIPPSINTAIIENQKSGNQLDRAISLLSGQDLPGMVADKNATGLKGYLPTGLLNRIDPTGVSARAEIADIGSLKIHDRSGSAVTVSESPRLMPFIPLTTDDRETALKKLQRLKLEIDTSSAAMKEIYSTDQGYRENPILNKPSVGGKITSMQEIQEVATKTGKSVEQVKQDALAKGYKVQ